MLLVHLHVLTPVVVLVHIPPAIHTVYAKLQITVEKETPSVLTRLLQVTSTDARIRYAHYLNPANFLSSISVTNAPVVGNGMTIGYTNGVSNVGLVGATNGTGYRASAFNKIVSTTISSGANIEGDFGLTTNPTKSGLIAKFSGLTLGTVPSEKLGNFYIRYL